MQHVSRITGATFFEIAVYIDYIWCYIHHARAWLLSSLSLPSQQLNMADCCWMKFPFIQKTSLQVQDIWKDGEFSKCLLLPLDQKSFQELLFKAFKNCKCSVCVDRQQVRSIDRNLFFFKLKLVISRWWWQLWMKSTMITKVLGESIFYRVLPNCFTAELDEQTDWQSMHMLAYY